MMGIQKYHMQLLVIHEGRYIKPSSSQFNLIPEI